MKQEFENKDTRGCFYLTVAVVAFWATVITLIIICF